MLPMEKDPLTTAAAKARLVAPPKFAAVHCAEQMISAGIPGAIYPTLGR